MIYANMEQDRTLIEMIYPPKGVEPTLSLRHAFCHFEPFWTLDGDLFVHAQPFFEILKYYMHFKLRKYISWRVTTF